MGVMERIKKAIRGEPAKVELDLTRKEAKRYLSPPNKITCSCGNETQHYVTLSSGARICRECHQEEMNG